MTGESLTPLDQLARVFAAIDAARSYGYSMPAAMDAAGEELLDLDHGDLVAVAAALAALIATELRPLGAETLERWSQWYGFALHLREREP